MSDPAPRFFAVEDEGPRRLEAPAADETWLQVYDRLDLGSYSRLRSYPGARFFGLQEHLDRMDQSRELLRLAPTCDHERIRRALHEVTTDFPTESTFCRFDLLASPAHALGTESAVILCLSAFTPVPASYKEEGVGTHFSDLVRETPLAKRAAFVRERGGHADGGQEAYERLLLGPDGTLLEGSSSNVFFLLDGTLRTAREGVLEGVTQRFCLRIAQDLGLPVERRPIHVDDIPPLQEAFLTSASRGVVPIVEIEGQAIGDGRPGPWTRQLQAGYDALAEREARPAWPMA